MFTRIGLRRGCIFSFHPNHPDTSMETVRLVVRELAMLLIPLSVLNTMNKAAPLTTMLFKG